MLRAVVLAAAVLLVGAVAGCSDDGDQQTSEPGAATLAVETTLDRVVESSDPAVFCRILSSRQLAESFGASDALARCRENAERRGDGSPLRSYEVVEVEGNCARVDIEDQRGRDAVFFMRKTDGRWLVDNIEMAPISSVVNLCGRVPFSGEER
jgi:hypothetical protein